MSRPNTSPVNTTPNVFSSRLLNAFYNNVASSINNTAIYDQSFTIVDESLRQITYSALIKEIDCIAKKIMGLTTTQSRNSPICLIGNYKLGHVILQLSILRAGHFFVVLDNHLPNDVIESYLDGLGIQLVIACDIGSKEVRWQHIDFSGEILTLTELDNLNNFSNVSLPDDIGDDALAYILLTSGSTGKPKAVTQTHGGLYHQIQRYYQIIDARPGEHFSSFAPLFHDQAIIDIYAALLLPQAKLCLFENQQVLFSEQHGVERAQAFLDTQKITVFSGIPLIFEMIFANSAYPERFSTLRIIAIGADDVTLRHVGIFSDSCPPNSLLINSYGMSEYSWMSGYWITHTQAKKMLAEQTTTIPIARFCEKHFLRLDGNPDHTLIYFIDTEYAIEEASTRPTDDTTEEQLVGELCIGGDGLSPGYYHNEEETDRAFFIKCLPGQTQAIRFYRTGDIVKLDKKNNTVLHQGRLAHIQKINGKRINLKEVERALQVILQCERSVVLVIEIEGQKQLFGFLKTPIVDPNYQVQINTQLAQHLRPNIIWIDQFPVLANGKIDRAALKEKAFQKISITQHEQNTITLERINPFNIEKVEALIIEILKKVTGEQDFDFTQFEFRDILDSIKSMMLIKKINDRLEQSVLQVADLLVFHNPSELVNAVRYHATPKNFITDILIRHYPKSDRAIIYFNELRCLIHHAMTLDRNLILIPTESLDDFVVQLKEQRYNKVRWIAYTVPVDHRYPNTTDKIHQRNLHPIPCFAEYNTITDSQVIWISESHGISKETNIIATYLNAAQFNYEVIFFVDTIERQPERDDQNCVSDTLSILFNRFYYFRTTSHIKTNNEENDRTRDFLSQDRKRFGGFFHTLASDVHYFPTLFLSPFLKKYNQLVSLPCLSECYTTLLEKIISKPRDTQHTALLHHIDGIDHAGFTDDPVFLAALESPYPVPTYWIELVKNKEIEKISMMNTIYSLTPYKSRLVQVLEFDNHTLLVSALHTKSPELLSTLFTGYLKISDDFFAAGINVLFEHVITHHHLVSILIQVLAHSDFLGLPLLKIFSRSSVAKLDLCLLNILDACNKAQAVDILKSTPRGIGSIDGVFHAYHHKLSWSDSSDDEILDSNHASFSEELMLPRKMRLQLPQFTSLTESLDELEKNPMDSGKSKTRTTEETKIEAMYDRYSHVKQIVSNTKTGHYFQLNLNEYDIHDQKNTLTFLSHCLKKQFPTHQICLASAESGDDFRHAIIQKNQIWIFENIARTHRNQAWLAEHFSYIIENAKKAGVMVFVTSYLRFEVFLNVVFCNYQEPDRYGSLAAELLEYPLITRDARTSESTTLKAQTQYAGQGHVGFFTPEPGDNLGKSHGGREEWLSLDSWDHPPKRTII